MRQQKNRASGVPAPVRVGMLIAAVGGVAGVLVVMGSLRAVWVVAIGAVAVGLLLGCYVLLLRWLDRRKSRPFEQKITRSAAAGSRAVADAATKAALDDLRKRFEQGVAKFREHGKDIYSLPWYLLVGEPGSGKTEAIRHCNVGFPPGLQDRLQGTGGTLNMHWWFTNHAVILDTAGRLLFDDAPEWQEFLKLLRQARPDSPVNGMLLVIPADSLVKDSPEEMEEKSHKIADALAERLAPVIGIISGGELKDVGTLRQLVGNSVSYTDVTLRVPPGAGFGPGVTGAAGTRRTG